MRIALTTETDTKDKFDFSMKIVARQVIRAVLTQENCPFGCEVSLLITGSERIHQINREYRHIDRETDVLSFPSMNFDAPSDFTHVSEDAADNMNPENGLLFLGDIVINTERVRSQALLYGHSEKREFAFLVAHSVLHLCGYDHETPEEASDMEARQEKALSSLGITREKTI